MANINNVGTFNLVSEAVTIIAEYNISNVSVILVSGTVTVKGVKKIGARDDDAIVLVAGTPLNLSFGFAIDGLTIDATAGAATLVVAD